ncbi:hypothetical protein ACQP3F_27450, partial [Escherichia coli]
EISKARAIPSVFPLPPAYGSDVSTQLLLQCCTHLPAVVLPAMMVMDSLCGIIRKPQIKCSILISCLGASLQQWNND